MAGSDKEISDSLLLALRDDYLGPGGMGCRPVWFASPPSHAGTSPSPPSCAAFMPAVRARLFAHPLVFSSVSPADSPPPAAAPASVAATTRAPFSASASSSAADAKQRTLEWWASIASAELTASLAGSLPASPATHQMTWRSHHSPRSPIIGVP